MSLENLIVLDLLNEDNRESITGKTKFQKLIFLIEDELKKKGATSDFNFVPFRFGPYSSKLSFLIDEMIRKGFIKRIKKTFDNQEIISFSITEDGVRELVRLQQNENNENVIKVVRAFKSYFKKYPLDKLLMAVYKKYPQFTSKSELIAYKF